MNVFSVFAYYSSYFFYGSSHSSASLTQVSHQAVRAQCSRYYLPGFPSITLEQCFSEGGLDSFSKKKTPEIAFKCPFPVLSQMCRSGIPQGALNLPLKQLSKSHSKRWKPLGWTTKSVSPIPVFSVFCTSKLQLPPGPLQPDVTSNPTHPQQLSSSPSMPVSHRHPQHRCKSAPAAFSSAGNRSTILPWGPMRAI